MRLTSYGAAGMTTGSCHLLEVNGSKILLDCGLREGKREETYRRNKHFGFSPHEIDCVLLSHAHTDHAANLPNLCKQGFTGNIYTTFATRDLCSVMLQDSAHIQASDIRFVNKKRAKRGESLFKVLYSAVDAEKCLRQFVGIGYNRTMPVADGVTATFIDAGHILGSAQVLLDIREGSSHKRFLFSGDVGRGSNDILRDPEIAENIDYLLMESTYGGREHEPIASARETMTKAVHSVIDSGGKLIIPSFAVGRTQQVVYALHVLTEEAKIPSIPVFVDSPMAVNATEIFRLHPECYNESIYDFLQDKRNPFGWEDIQYIRHVQRSMELNNRKGPLVIISASGMCEAGRILHHLRNNISNSKNTVLFVGHCAEHTLGARILRDDKPIRIFGQEHELNARVLKLDAYSGHADHSELCDYAEKTAGRRAHIFLVHGEPEAAEAMRDGLKEKQIGKDIHINVEGESIDLS